VGGLFSPPLLFFLLRLFYYITVFSLAIRAASEKLNAICTPYYFPSSKEFPIAEILTQTVLGAFENVEGEPLRPNVVTLAG
jgi:hypothetical protein